MPFDYLATISGGWDQLLVGFTWQRQIQRAISKGSLCYQKKKKKKSCKHANELSLNDTSSLVRVGWMVCLCVQNLPGVYVT